MAEEETPVPTPSDEELTDLAPLDDQALLADRPNTIGPYRLLQKIGEGGMGEVWEAEQTEPVRRRVALKLVKPGMDSKQVIARFESERQALALMNHPNIAKVFDAGETPRERPYFVMEYIKGEPITEYCDKNRLSTEARLKLFIDVCEGVQHAHHKAVIHRDIKPSNILVMVQGQRAVPKIIDFGVAKATDQRLTERTLYTELGQFIGTPEYMSPEQAEMTGADVDTRTDVYSLGVLLYELLVGALPFDPKELRRAGFDEIRRRIREDDPPRPSTRLSQLAGSSAAAGRGRRREQAALVRRLRGDLDWITLKALEKDRTRRYASASELSADVDRFLSNQPVIASPPSFVYKARKFVSRNKVGVSFAASVALLLVALAVTMTVQAGRIARERDRANREAASARQVSEFLVDLFRGSNPWDMPLDQLPSGPLSARKILDRGAERIGDELSDQPLIEARLQGAIGTIYAALGVYDEAEGFLRSALSTREEHLPADSPEVARSLADLADLYMILDRNSEAEEHYQRALRIRRTALDSNPVDVADTLTRIAWFRYSRGALDEALDLFEQAEAIHRQTYGADHDSVQSHRFNIGRVLSALGRYDEAAEIMEQSIARIEQGGELRPAFAGLLNDLAIAYGYQGRTKEAESLLRRGLEIYRTVPLGDAAVGMTLGNLGWVYHRQQKYDDAESLFEQAIESYEEIGEGDDLEIATVLHDFGSMEFDRRRYEHAETLLQRALEIRQSSPAVPQDELLATLTALVRLYESRGQPGEAAKYRARFP